MTTTPRIAPDIEDEETVGTAFVRALAARDLEKLRACLHPEVQLSALVPSGYQETQGQEAVLARLESWFGAAETLRLLKEDVYHVSHRLHIRYRFGEQYSDGDSEVIEQDAYCYLHEGRIATIDLLCSGHLPAPGTETAAVQRFDAGELGCGSGLPQEFRRQVAAVPVGSVLETTTRDPAAKEDLPALARLLGHEVMSITTAPDGATIIAVKRAR